MKSCIYNKYILCSFFTCVLCLCACGEKEDLSHYYTEATREALANLENQIIKDGSRPLKSDKAKNRFRLVHLSDVHISKSSASNNPQNPENLAQAIHFANLPEAHIDAMVMTGDLINPSPEDDKRTARKYFEAFASAYYALTNAVPSFVSTGNHDANMLGVEVNSHFSKAEINQILFKKVNYPIVQPAGENYYYVDLNGYQDDIFRIIALDNTDQEAADYNTQQACSITQKQVDWLVNVALKENMTDKHKVIILNHHPLQRFSKDRSTYMCSGYHLYGPKMIPSIINAYMQRKQWNKTYKTVTSPYSTITVHADFTTSIGEFVCYMGGHAHTTAHFNVDCGEEGAPKQLMLLANTMTPNLQNNGYGTIDRAGKGNNSFSIYCIDTEEKNIYITYFGARKESATEVVSYQ